MNLTGNLYDILRNISDTKGTIGLIREYPFDKVKEYYDNLGQDIDYRYFVCLLEKDFNFVIKYYQNNESFLHELIKVSDDIYSIFGYMNYDSIDIMFKYLNKHEDELELFQSSIRCIDYNELYKYIRLSNDDKLISYLLNNNINLYKKFVMEDDRAIRFINDKLINIRIVEYPENLKNSNIIFDSLKSYSIVNFRNNIEKFSNINKIYSIQEKFEKYEDLLINRYNKETKEFDISGLNLDNDRYIINSFGFQDNAEKKFNELIIDRLFRDNYNNVVLNIKEILRYSKHSNLIDEERLKLYNDIINFKELTYEEKMNLYNKYKDQKLYTKFYLDTMQLRSELYSSIKNNLYQPENKNEDLTKKCDTDVYLLDGENFSMLIRALSEAYSSFYTQERECFSIINNDNTSRFRGEVFYGYTNFNPEKIISINEYDAYSSKDGQTDYINRLMTVDELAKTRNYNEVQIQTNKESLKPSYVVAFNEISDMDIFESQKLGIPIVLIKEEKYNKKDKQGGMFVEREQYVDSSYHEYRGHTL